MLEILKVIAALIVTGSLLMSQSASAKTDPIEINHRLFRQFFDPIDEKIAECDSHVETLKEAIKAALDETVVTELAGQALDQCSAEAATFTELSLPEGLDASLASDFLGAGMKCLAAIEARVQYAKYVRNERGFRSEISNTLNLLNARWMILAAEQNCLHSQTGVFLKSHGQWFNDVFSKVRKNLGK